MQRGEACRGVTIDDVRALASTLERSYEAVVRDRVKFRVGQIVYLAFSRDDTLMGFAFPKEERAALVASEPHKFMLPKQRDMRYNWVVVRLAEIDHRRDDRDRRGGVANGGAEEGLQRIRQQGARHMTGVLSAEVLTGETVELLQAMIRNRCVNDGTAESGYETRNADLLRSVPRLDAGSTCSSSSRRPVARSLVARIEGSDPTAPSLCLMGHTDVVPVNESGWSRDPFGGELVDGEVWGRGAVDMLNLTASMAVAFRHLAVTGFRPRGDLIYFAVADEESGSAHGMQWMADHERDAIRADYVLTENGGLHSGPERAAVHLASTSARRASPGAGCACAARPATARCRSRPTTR